MDKRKYYNAQVSEDYNSQVSRIMKYIPKKFTSNLIQSDKVKRSGTALNITIQVTEDCNLACSYCYQICKSKTRLQFETAKKFIDLLLDPDQSKNASYNSYTSNFVVLDFIGGEPLLEIDLIRDICKYFVKRLIELDHPWKLGYMLSIGSNGVLYFDPRVQSFLKEFNNKVSMAITLDGNKELHDSCRVFHNGEGSYDTVIKAINDWNKRFPFRTPSSKLTIAPENVKYLKDAILHMVDIGYRHINENCVFEEGWTAEHAKILYNQCKDIADYLLDNDLDQKVTLRIFDPDSYSPMDPANNSNWCGGDGSMLALDVHGNIFNCVRYMKSALGGSQEPLKIGDVDNGIAVLEQDKKCLSCMRCITRKSQSTEECFNCPIAQGCGWCSAYNYQVFGTVNKRATFTCIMHKALSLVNTYYWNKLYRKYNEKEMRISVNCPKEWALDIISEDEYNMLVELSEPDTI